MKKIRVLIVDDHDIVILGLKALISRNHDIEIVDSTSNGEEAIEKVNKLNPDVIILDIDLPEISGIDVAKHISNNFPDVRILLHSSFADEDNIVKGFEAGASGFVHKTYKTDQLIEAIRTVYKGDRYIKGNVSELFIASFFKNKKQSEDNDADVPSLTQREIDIIKLLSTGLGNQEIADKLFISRRTVEVHKHNMMKKLNIFHTAELVKYAIKKNIIKV